ncbi:MAG: DUF5107 domain-containing protein [Phycisphaerae bacterium]|nr:DUF5107 domain-containing protein [Phycisphaerae bacterium]
MTDLRMTTLHMPAARLGLENPLPPLSWPRQLSSGVEVHESVPEIDREGLGYGEVSGCLPYGMQDDYGRHRRPQDFKVAVLENDVLRATFLTEYGGRLWSLYHKPTRRELVYVNPVFQPANVAIRNAWLSGGVEWNVSLRGHATHTCSPVFVARVAGEDGTPVLRLYEWDRIRGVPWQIDFHLPDGSPMLLVRVRLVNPHDSEIPMYWWSNIAAPESPDLRVLVPTDRAYNHGYRGLLSQVTIPKVDDLDVTYPSNIPAAADYFYRIPDGHRPWIAYLDRSGRGLFHASTSRLVARKLFVWGQGPGGKRWQDFLTEPGHPYVELQAGLIWTQSHMIRMPGRAEWSWLEAYGLMEADGTVVHGSDWPAAWQVVEKRLDEIAPQEWLEQELARTEGTANRVPEEALQVGSGWGALERRRRERAGEGPLCSGALAFDDASLGKDQAPWLELLERGRFPERDPSDRPGAWMVQPEWRDLLAQSIEDGASDHWLAWLHLGVMEYRAGRVPEAKRAWNRSVARTPSLWAYRNLAVVAKHDGRKEEAAELWLKALRMRPTLLPLAIECCQALIEADRARDLLALWGTLPGQVRQVGRIRTLEAQAAMAVGDLRRVEQILDGDLELTSNREGEVVLSDLWFELNARRLAEKEGGTLDDALRERVRREFPPPPHLDFRMAKEKA